MIPRPAVSLLLLGLFGSAAAADSGVIGDPSGTKSFAVYVRSADIHTRSVAPELLGKLQNTLGSLAAEGKINRVTIKKTDANGGKRVCVEFATQAAAAAARTLVEELINNVPQAELTQEACG